jgi:transposase, IS6 family
VAQAHWSEPIARVVVVGGTRTHGKHPHLRIHGPAWVEVVTDRAATYPIVLAQLLPAAWHRTDWYANNGVEADHGRLKSRLRSMRGLKQDHSARIVMAGHAFVQNVRRRHYELASEELAHRRLAIALAGLAVAI